MKSRKGFTLIELLVVISIICLLMSIIMPSLGRAKDKARDVSCLNNERQFGLAASVYADENNYKMTARTEAALWVEELRPYLGMKREASTMSSVASKGDVSFCPSANKTRYDSEGNMGKGSGLGPLSAWGVYNSGYQNGIAGSYGMNWWIYNVTFRDVDEGHKLVKQWGSFNVRGASRIPLILDSYTYGGYPEAFDNPPEYEVEAEYLTQGMRSFCVNRHNNRVNALFLDYSVRKVGLKELWTLSWHREYTNDWKTRTTRTGQPINWPDWMRNMKDYF
jgi:prepilin-type N-terminal cleavage/methylation domain-containing protein/prepilin-type processing-associated H-X9-DG protein